MTINLTGVWGGDCLYDPTPERPEAICRVSFTLKLHQGWFGRLSGHIQDDPNKGAPEPAPIKGKIRGNQLSFTMHRPVSYVMVAEKMITLAEYLLQAWKMPLDRPVEPYVVFYEGAVTQDGREISGAWHIPSGEIQFFSKGRWCEFPCPGTSGRWKVERQAAGS